MSYKLLQVSNLSALGVIGGNYGGSVATTTYPLYKNDLFLGTIGTETGKLSTAKVTVEQLTQAIYYDGNTTAPWLSADIGATRRVYTPVRVGIGSSSWASEYPYATLTVLGGISASEGLSAAPTRAGFRNVFMGNVGIGTNSFGTSETYMLNVAGNAKLTGNLEVGGNTTVTGNLVVGGNIDGGDATADTFTITALIDSDIVPDTDSSRDIGTSAKRWALGYFDTVHLTDDLELADNSEIRLGDGDDLRLVHNGTNSFVDNYTGNLYIRNNVDDDDGGDIYIQAKSGENSIWAADDGAVTLFYDTAAKLATKTDGVDVTGEVQCDSLDVDGIADVSGDINLQGNVTLGSGTSDQISMNGRTTAIVPVADSTYSLGTDALRWTKLWVDEIQTTGNVDIDGTLNVAGATTVAANMSFQDNDILSFGTGTDLQIFHNATDTILRSSTGELQFQVNNVLRIYGGADASETMAVFNDDGAVALYHNNAVKIATAAGGIDVTGDVLCDSLNVDGASQLDGTLTVGVDDTGYDVKFFGATSGQRLLWDESANALNLNDSVKLTLGSSSDVSMYHDGSNSYITNAVGALKIATETSGIAVTIGHTTSETTVADNLTVTGDLALGGSLTASGNLDINANIQLDGELVVGVDDTGYDVKFFGATSDRYLLWDQSQDALELRDNVKLKLGSGSDIMLYHDGSNSYITNSLGVLKIATETSGIAVTIGHTTSETTVADNLTVTGNTTVGGALATSSTLTVAGTTTLNGHVILGSNGSDNITFNGDVLGNITPNVDSSVSLGSTGARWLKLWVDEIQTTGNVDINGTLNVQGETTLQTHLNMGDSDIIKLGASADLQIFHNGSNSYVQDTGTGSLVLAGTQLYLQNGDADENFLACTDDGAVQIYYNNSVKLATTNTGISVTGDVSCNDQLISTVSTGTAPLAVSSTTQVSNLNASFLGGEPLWTAGNNWDVVPYTNSSGASKLGKSIQFFNGDTTADGSAQVTLDTGGGSTDLYINGNGSGTGDRVYNTSDFTWEEKKVAHAWCKFSEHSNGTITNHASYNVSGITNELNNRYQVRFTNAAGSVHPVNFVEYDPGYLISVQSHYAQPKPYLSNPASASSPYDGYTRATALRVATVQGTSGNAHDGDTYIGYYNDRLHELAGSNVVAINCICFST